MLADLQLATALASAQLIAVHGPWARAVMYRHLLTRSSRLRPLWGGAARVNGARFTPRQGFDSIHLAWDAVTAFAEVQAVILLSNDRLQPRTPPWVVMTINGVLSGILDLTDPRIRAPLGTTEQELTGSWEIEAEPPTQRIGRVAFESGRIVGIKYPSAKDRDGDNLVVFSDRLPLTPTNYPEVHDPDGHLSQRLGVERVRMV